MRRDLEYLPAVKRRELDRAVAIIMGEFDEAAKLSTGARDKAGRILRIVLFGSYARGGWVDEPHTAKGYVSDFDLLVVVDHDRLTDFADLWYKAEDRLLRAENIRTPVNFIVHTLGEGNDALASGQYFFSDIVREGVLLYELTGAKRFAAPRALDEGEALAAARKHYAQWMESAESFRRRYQHAMDDADPNKAAFDLHQTVERLYTAALLVLTNYSPATHNIKALRSLAEARAAALIDAWPRETRDHRRAFERLKRAYVEARYSEHYAITADELAWLGERAGVLRGLVARVCEARIAALGDKI